MRKTWLRLLAVLLAFTFVAAACGSDDSSNGSDTTEDSSGIPDQFPDPVDPVKGGRLAMTMSDPIDCYNGLSYYGISWSLFYFMARGLYGYPNSVETPDTDTIRADLAQDLPEVSDDKLTYTVKLREGLTFPDGSPVTSADVKATYEYMLDPNIQCSSGGPPSSGYYNVIDGYDAFTAALTANPKAAADLSGITTTDDLTTVFKLSHVDGAFVRALAMGWSFIIPAGTPHETLDTPPPFVGPYKVSEYTAEKWLAVDREPTWEKNVAAGVPEEDNENNIDGLDLAMGVPDDISLQKIKGNEVDISYDSGAPVGSDVPAVANDPAYEGRFFSTNDAGVDYGIFRTDKAPMDNLELRQAVNYAVDRDTLVKIWGGELNKNPWSELLSKNLMEDDVEPSYTLDVEKAKQLVEDSGVATPIKVTLAHYQDAPAPELAATVKENLDAIGFDVTLKGLSADVFQGFLQDNASDFDLALNGWSQDYADAITYFGPLLGCPDGKPTGSNYSRFCDTEFQASVDEISAMPDGPDRFKAFSDLAVSTAKEKAPWWTVTNRRHISFVSDRVGNFIWGPAKQFYFATYFVKDAG